MMLVWLIILPMAGGLLAWLSARWNVKWARWISMVTLAINLVSALAAWAQSFGGINLASHGPWLIEFNRPWIPSLGINLHLALDGLSLLLIVLTNLLGIMAVAASWTEIEEHVGLFHFNLLWIVAGISGVFLSIDLFLFYFFWEMMLVPMYLLIGLWGHERRVYAAAKFFLFTQFSGLLMLIGIVGLYFVHGFGTGKYTFDYVQLLGTPMAASTAMWLMLGFLIAFAVKLPVVPVHTWLPDAHTQAPTAGSLILAGLLLKTGAYGMLRFVVPLFPGAARSFAPVAMALAVMGILYGAILAFAQTDLKRLVAYTSISHMSFVLLGIMAWNELALQGAVIVILAHAVSTGALFILVGALQERLHTRDLNRMGGLWAAIPGMSGAGLVFAVASLGLPGLGNFVGEFLVLLGTYQVSVPAAILATLGFVASTVYSLWMVQLAFHGPNAHDWQVPDMTPRETAMMVVMTLLLLWMGLYPQTIIDTARPAIETLERYAVTTTVQRSPAANTLPTLEAIHDNR